MGEEKECIILIADEGQRSEIVGICEGYGDSRDFRQEGDGGNSGYSKPTLTRGSKTRM